MGDLTKNFSRHEIVCQCGCGTDHVQTESISALQRLREIDGRPMVLNSAVRCEDHNRAVGGGERSQHLYGKAFDIRLDGRVPDVLIANAIRAGFRGIGKYPSFIHVDTRKRSARWNGK
ncbi:D-Ala-D-Ala carboxypeptidase family metallohydrolase [Magnetovibrio sp. PR-2]|uniref:D-Ala-D-Ala carboxypeptidase family metallohydrolase n=1 Tax=Magnetovibrio sp. PR-2 TaxID=3120356 RepID=UPI003FA587A4